MIFPQLLVLQKICSFIFFIYENANALHIWSFLFPIVGKFVTWSWHGYGSYFFNGANKWRVQVWQFCIWSSRCTCFLLEESRPWLLKIKIIEHYFDWWGKDRWRRKTYLFTPPGSIWDANMITFHGLRTRLQSVFSSQPWWVQILSWGANLLRTLNLEMFLEFYLPTGTKDWFDSVWCNTEDTPRLIL